MVNQVCFQVMGCDQTVALACEAGQLELNVMMPVIAWNALHASKILREALKVFRLRCVEGITADEARARELLDRSTAAATALSPYIGYAATADVAKTSVASGKTIRDFSNANPESSLGSGWDSVLGIAFSHDGKLMACGGFSNDKGNYFARLWEAETGKELRRFMHGKTSYGIPSLAFSPDAKMLATRAHDGRLRLFDVDTGKGTWVAKKSGDELWSCIEQHVGHKLGRRLELARG